MNAPIGVFDSGIGGLSVLRALRAQLPHEDFTYLADTAHTPYGERGDDYVIARSRTVVRQLREEHGIKALVIACNTATAAAVHLLRAENPGLPIVGVEPALKPAVALTRTRRIGVMATRGTLASAKFRALAQSLSGEAQFVVRPCDGLADAIERNDTAQIEELGARHITALGKAGTGDGEVDTIVLGCTHYFFALDSLRRHTDASVQFIETGVPVARHTQRLLGDAGLLAAEGKGRLVLICTGSQASLDSAAERWQV